MGQLQCVDVEFESMDKCFDMEQQSEIKTANIPQSSGKYQNYSVFEHIPIRMHCVVNFEAVSGRLMRKTKH